MALPLPSVIFALLFQQPLCLLGCARSYHRWACCGLYLEICQAEVFRPQCLFLKKILLSVGANQCFLEVSTVVFVVKKVAGSIPLLFGVCVFPS